MEKDTKVLLKGLSKFTDERNIKKVRLIFDEFHPSDVYKEINDWPNEKSVLLLRLLHAEGAAELFSEMTPKQQTTIIELLSTEEISEIFEELYTDEAVDVLDELPAKITRRVIASANHKTRKKINKILRYEKYQNGYHMVVDYVALPSNLSIKQAKNSITKQINNDDLEIVGNIFVYDEITDNFIGYITPDDIISRNDNENIYDLIEKITAVSTTGHISNAQDALTQYNIPSIAVLDSKNKLVGVIEAEDIIEWYEEAGDTILEQSAIKVINKPYLEITIWEMFKSRIPWIIILLIIGSITQLIILGFQSWWFARGWIGSGNTSSAIWSSVTSLAIASAISLSSSINGAAGNTASQTSSTLVRAISLGEVGKGTYLKALNKEVISSIFVGGAVMITGFLRIIIVWAIFGGFSHTSESLTIGQMFIVAAVASVSFFLTILIGNFLATILPIFANRFGIDGAVFSGPVQATIIDIITIALYFLLTTLLLFSLGL